MWADLHVTQYNGSFIRASLFHRLLLCSCFYCVHRGLLLISALQRGPLLPAWCWFVPTSGRVWLVNLAVQHLFSINFVFRLKGVLSTRKMDHGGYVRLCCCNPCSMSTARRCCSCGCMSVEECFTHTVLWRAPPSPIEQFFLVITSQRFWFLHYVLFV